MQTEGSVQQEGYGPESKSRWTLIILAILQGFVLNVFLCISSGVDFSGVSLA